MLIKSIKQKMLNNAVKSKTMIFNTSDKFQFTTSIKLHENNLEVLDEVKLLGTIITSYLKWNKNTFF